MAREEVEISWHLMLTVVVEDATGQALVTGVVAEEVAMEEEDEVDMEVAVQGGAKPDISIRSYTDQEWALLSYNEKGEVFALRDKYERQKINAVEI